MRLVDADVLLNGLDSICVEKMNSKKPCPLVCTLCPLSDMLDVIEDAPTVDAVPVVRCKDCKHNQLPSTSASANCDLWYGMTDLFGYCSSGERREDDGK